MKIGITGWRGFIGSHLSTHISTNPVLFQGDIRDSGAVKEFVGQCDRIYHLAGKNKAEEGQILANNIAGTGNLVLATKSLGKNVEIVFTSSKQVEWNPNSEYGMTKMIEESIIRTARKWCIFRIPNVYGEGCKPFYNSVVATFCWQIAHGEVCTTHQPFATREFVYVDDLVDALVEPVVYRVIRVSGEVMSIKEVHEYLTTRLGEHEKLKKCLDYYKEDKDVPTTQEGHWLVPRTGSQVRCRVRSTEPADYRSEMQKGRALPYSQEGVVLLPPREVLYRCYRCQNAQTEKYCSRG